MAKRYELNPYTEGWYREFGGKTEIHRTCPECSHTRSRAGRKEQCVTISKAKKHVGCVAKCHHCDRQGFHFINSQDRRHGRNREQRMAKARERFFAQ